MSLERLKTGLPWPAKIAAKIVLSRLPFGYGLWQRAQLFRHGAMDDPDYAIRVFRTHFTRSGMAARPGPFTVLELGPGDTVATAVIARAHGAGSSILVDSGDYATKDMGVYRRLIARLDKMGLPVGDMADAEDVRGLLARANAIYLTEGIFGLNLVPKNVIDFVMSQAVLEHVRRREFLMTLQELKRVMKPDGVASHRIDLRDHLAAALNNLRFSDRVWESEFIARSGFYTNRIRYSEMLDLFAKAGFETEVLDVTRWPTLPTPRKKMSATFRDLSEDELLVSNFDVLLRPY